MHANSRMHTAALFEDAVIGGPVEKKNREHRELKLGNLVERINQTLCL